MTKLDHLGLKATDFDRALAFYEAALSAIGIKCLTNFEFDGVKHAGFGVQSTFFWLSGGAKSTGDTHVAFTASSRAGVESFYTIALSMGGRDNGKPGLRPHYHPNYYGAFVLDPDGNNLEAVYHGGE